MPLAEQRGRNSLTQSFRVAIINHSFSILRAVRLPIAVVSSSSIRPRLRARIKPRCRTSSTRSDITPMPADLASTLPTVSSGTHKLTRYPLISPKRRRLSLASCAAHKYLTSTTALTSIGIGVAASMETRFCGKISYLSGRSGALLSS